MGQALVERLVHNRAKKIIVFSRDEHKQVEMERRIKDPDKRVRYFLGDVRDRDRLYRAFTGVDIVIHAAAMKHVGKSEYNPFEAVQTNIIGAQNVIDAAIDRGVKKVLAISSDKAVNPCNLYGATKLCADKLFLAADSYAGKSGTKFSVIRFGNYLWSRGSVLPYWKELVDRGEKVLPITDMRMRRFWISLDDAVSRCVAALVEMEGGEIFVPKMQAERVQDIAIREFRGVDLKEIGIGKGEKLSEELITSEDAPYTREWGDFYVIGTDRGKLVEREFRYRA